MFFLLEGHVNNNVIKVLVDIVIYWNRFSFQKCMLFSASKSDWYLKKKKKKSDWYKVSYFPITSWEIDGETVETGK